MAHQVWSYDLRQESIEEIKEVFGTRICADEAFWEARSNALYATLIHINATVSIPPIQIRKRDRRGWVSLSKHQPLFYVA